MNGRFRAALVSIALSFSVCFPGCDINPMASVPAWPVRAPATQADVYIGGFYGSGPIDMRACYWANGAFVDLETPDSCVDAIMAVGDVVYAVGRTNASIEGHACYWVRSAGTSVRYDLETGQYSEPRFIRANGADMYILGTCGMGVSAVTRRWHTQGAALLDYADFDDAPGRGYFLDGSDVYSVGGPSAGDYYYSKNDVPVRSFSVGAMSPGCMFVDGTNVYITGGAFNEHGYPGPVCYWKDGARIDIPGRGSITAIAADGADVYIIGTRKDYYDPTIVCRDYAVLWHNTDLFVLPAEDAVPFAVQVVGDDVYAAGHASDGYAQTACVWVNGTMSILPHPDGATANAVAIFARPE